VRQQLRVEEIPDAAETEQGSRSARQLSRVRRHHDRKTGFREQSPNWLIAADGMSGDFADGEEYF
jgi:hypothetical protein